MSMRCSSSLIGFEVALVCELDPARAAGLAPRTVVSVMLTSSHSLH
jgi:hypothetical protein